MATDSSLPKLGYYIGKEPDYTCPTDNVTFEILILADSVCTISCSSTLSPSKGGTDSWKVEGTWVYSEDYDEITVTITQEDPAGGPKDDRDLELALEEDGSALKYKGTLCVWEKPPPDAWLEKHLAMTTKELKDEVIKHGFDPAGCIEKDDFLQVLERGRASGTLKKDPVPPKTVKEVPPPVPTNPVKEDSPVTPAETSTPVAPPPPTASAEVSTPEVPKDTLVTGAPPQEGTFTLEQLTDKRIWEKLDIKSAERETYLPDTVFAELFGMSKDDFSKLPKWKKDGAKKKHGLF